MLLLTEPGLEARLTEAEVCLETCSVPSTISPIHFIGILI